MEPHSSKALGDVHWRQIVERKMSWHLNHRRWVVLHDPRTGRTATAKTVYQAFVQVMNRDYA